MEITLNVTLITALMSLIFTGFIFLVGFLALLYAIINAHTKSLNNSLEDNKKHISTVESKQKNTIGAISVLLDRTREIEELLKNRKS